VVWANVPDAQPAWAPGVSERIAAVNDALALVDAELAQLSVIDLRAHFAGHWPEWYAPDQWHWNDAGAREYAVVTCRALDGFDLTEAPAECDPAPATTTTAGP
jgi:hypothetical protein